MTSHSVPIKQRGLAGAGRFSRRRGGDDGGTSTQARPSGDEVVVGARLRCPTLIVGDLIQQIRKLTGTITVTTEIVQQLGRLRLRALQRSRHVLGGLPHRQAAVLSR